MEEKKKITIKQVLPFIGIFLFAIVLSLTYAYIRKTNTQTNPNTGATLTCLNTTLTDKTSAINIKEAISISDEEGMTLNPYSFTLTNTCNTYVKATINLESLSTTTIDLSHIRVSLNDEGNETNLSKLLNAYPSATSTISGATSYMLKDKIILAPNSSKTFDLRAWVDKDTTAEQGMNKVFNAKIVVNYDAYRSPSNNAEAFAWANTDTRTENGGMETIEQPVTTQLAATTEYRYYGSNPNNYVKFNDELWRIIGIFETADSAGNLNYRVKLIRNDSLGNFSWDYKESGVGSSTFQYGSNDWSDSQLMMMLNSNKYLKSGYDASGTLLHQGYSITDGNVSDGTRTIFKNMGSYLDSALEAYKPASTPTTGYTGSTMTLPRLSTTVQTMIDEITYYLGGTDTASITSSEYYNRERSTTVYSNRPVKWIGQIGLMYMSDYGYAADPSLCARTQKLYYNAADGYYGTAACHINNWLWKSGQIQWTIVPSSSYSNHVALVSSSGYAFYSNAVYGCAGRPVLYLKSETKITGGLGTSSNPYILG